MIAIIRRQLTTMYDFNQHSNIITNMYGFDYHPNNLRFRKSHALNLCVLIMQWWLSSIQHLKQSSIWQTPKSYKSFLQQAYVCMYTHISRSLSLYIYVYIYTYRCIHLERERYLYIYIYIHTYIIYIHIWMCIYIYIYISEDFGRLTRD